MAEPVTDIVDAHHHLWDTENRYGRYPVSDLMADTALVPAVSQTVFVDCGAGYFTDGPVHLRPVGETVYVARCAEETAAAGGATIAGIVGRADLRLGAAVAEVLDHHVEASGGRFRGIRQIGANDPTGTVESANSDRPLGLYRRNDFRTGARVLADRGFTFDAWQYYYQLDDVVDLALTVPDLVIVVNHLGGPVGVGPYAERIDEVLSETRAGLARLAAQENTVLKLGGVGMVRYGTGWERQGRRATAEQVVAHWGELIHFAIECFGPDRCMFESNFPVDAETIDYDELWAGFQMLTEAYSNDDRQALFAGTARRVYRLERPGADDRPVDSPR